MRNRVTSSRGMATARLANALVCVGVLVLVSCTPPATPVPAPVQPLSSELIQVEPWPEADTLFRSNPRWMGSDDAYSIDLGDGRTLWLFGDTFISRTFLNTRRLSTMIRNSVAIQSGYGGAVPLWGGDMAELTKQVTQGGSMWVFKLPKASR